MSIKVDHVTKSDLVRGKLGLSSDAQLVFAAAAQLRAGHRVKDRDLMKLAVEIANKKLGSDQPRYQLETILRTDFRGQSLSGDSRPWCFYVAWHKTKMPRAVDAREIASSVWTTGAKFLPDKVAFTDTSETLTSILDEAFYEQNSRYGLEFSVDQVEEAVNFIAEAAPNAALLTNSADLELRKIFRHAKYTGSDTLIPDDIVKRQWQAVMAARALASKRVSAMAAKGNSPSGSNDTLQDDVNKTQSSTFTPWGSGSD